MTIVRDADRSDRSGLAQAALGGLWIALAASLLSGRSTSAQTPVPPATPDFAMSAAQSDQYEILAARDALAQSQDPQVKAFAQQIIEDHTRMIESLKQAATAAGLPPPSPAMSGDQAAMLASLQSLRGIEFDRAYARQQVLAHRQALAVEGSYAKSGADATLRGVALSAITVIQKHLEMAEQMRTALGDS